VSQGEALGTKIGRNGGAGRPGHVAGEHGRIPARKTARSSAMPPYPLSTMAMEVMSR